LDARSISGSAPALCSLAIAARARPSALMFVPLWFIAAAFDRRSLARGLLAGSTPHLLLALAPRHRRELAA
jgi:hypothetical protein